MTGARRPVRIADIAALSKPNDRPRDTAAIDLTHLDRQCCGDRSLATELLASFTAQARTLARRLASEPGLSATTRADLAHRLRGSALAVGAFDVARAAQAVEAAGRPHDRDGRGGADADEMSQAVSALLEAVLRTADAIDRLEA